MLFSLSRKREVGRRDLVHWTHLLLALPEQGEILNFFGHREESKLRVRVGKI
jgi:hypothetical protein